MAKKGLLEALMKKLSPEDAAEVKKYGLTEQKLQDAQAMGYDINEIFWRGGPDGVEELPPGRAGSAFFSPQRGYAEQYEMGGATHPYLLRPGNQYDPSRNPAHEKDMARRFNKEGGWGPTQEDNYVFDEDQIAERGKNWQKYNPALDEQWEVMDEPETDILSDVLDKYDSVRMKERQNEGYEGIMMYGAGDEAVPGIRRLDAEFNPDRSDSRNVLASGAPIAAGLLGLGAAGGSQDAEAANWQKFYRGQPRDYPGTGLAGRYFDSDPEYAGTYDTDPLGTADKAPVVYPAELDVENFQVEDDINKVTDWEYDQAALEAQGKTGIMDAEGTTAVPFREELIRPKFGAAAGGGLLGAGMMMSPEEAMASVDQTGPILKAGGGLLEALGREVAGGASGLYERLTGGTGEEIQSARKDWEGNSIEQDPGLMAGLGTLGRGAVEALGTAGRKIGEVSEPLGRAVMDYDSPFLDGGTVGDRLTAFGGDVAEGWRNMTPEDQEALKAGGLLASAIGIPGKKQVVEGAIPPIDKRQTLNKKQMQEALAPYPDEASIVRSFNAAKELKGKGRIPTQDVQTALENRLRYREEPQVLPKPMAEMTDQDYVDFGNQYGVDMSRTPSQSMGISDPRTRQELMVPGGLEGKFTIPDLFEMKANNFDPGLLDQATHTELMKKFIRTYDRGAEHDVVDKFNDLNFSLLSPNAPLTQNEFLAMRLRQQDPEGLVELAARAGEPGLNESIDAASGVGAASRGGLGAKGTAMLNNQADLAKQIIEKPEMFSPGPGETIRDVGNRVMNQVPGLSVKTAGLGVPWTNLNEANTSAVDLWMVRKNWERLKKENPDFAKRHDALMAKNKNKAKDKQLTEEDAAINIIGGSHPNLVYRSKKTGEVMPNVPDYLQPDKLNVEPEKYSMPNKFYEQIMGYVDESRGANPEIELFPEQWRLWDTYRGRVEPHEMAHPDYRKLPKQSFTELLDSFEEHKRLGYTKSPEEGQLPLPTRPGDWKKLYYGEASPEMMGLLGLGAAGAGAYQSRKEDK